VDSTSSAAVWRALILEHAIKNIAGNAARVGGGPVPPDAPRAPDAGALGELPLALTPRAYSTSSRELNVAGSRVEEIQAATEAQLRHVLEVHSLYRADERWGEQDRRPGEILLISSFWSFDNTVGAFDISAGRFVSNVRLTLRMFWSSCRNPSVCSTARSA
jgi:hypothetical protein